MPRRHYNSPERYSAPWQDAGTHRTRTAGLRRLWLHPPHQEGAYWSCIVAGEGSTSGASREEALANGRAW